MAAALARDLAVDRATADDIIPRSDKPYFIHIDLRTCNRAGERPEALKEVLKRGRTIVSQAIHDFMLGTVKAIDPRRVPTTTAASQFVDDQIAHRRDTWPAEQRARVDAALADPMRRSSIRVFEEVTGIGSGYYELWKVPADFNHSALIAHAVAQLQRRLAGVPHSTEVVVIVHILCMVDDEHELIRLPLTTEGVVTGALPDLL